MTALMCRKICEIKCLPVLKNDFRVVVFVLIFLGDKIIGYIIVFGLGIKQWLDILETIGNQSLRLGCPESW